MTPPPPRRCFPCWLVESPRRLKLFVSVSPPTLCSGVSLWLGYSWNCGSPPQGQATPQEAPVPKAPLEAEGPGRVPHDHTLYPERSGCPGSHCPSTWPERLHPKIHPGVKIVKWVSEILLFPVVQMGKLRPIEAQETIQGYRRILVPSGLADFLLGALQREQAGVGGQGTKAAPPNQQSIKAPTLAGCCLRPRHLLQMYTREAQGLQATGSHHPAKSVGDRMIGQDGVGGHLLKSSLVYEEKRGVDSSDVENGGSPPLPAVPELAPLTLHRILFGHWHHRFTRVQSALCRCSALREKRTQNLRTEGYPCGVWGRGLSRTRMRRETEAELQRGSPMLLLTPGSAHSSGSVYTPLLCSLTL